MKFYSLTNVGLVRNNNEDAVWCGENSFGNFAGVVCDGLGGYKGGSAASDICIEVFKRRFAEIDFNNLEIDEIKDWMQNTIDKTREEITSFIFAHLSQQLANMATTLVCAIIVKEKVYVFNVGDSRAFKISKEKSYQITEDQNLYNYFVKNNEPEEKFIKYKDNLYAITQFIGATSNRAVKPDLFETTFKNGDYIILSSDGLHNFCTIKDMIDSIIAEDTYIERCNLIMSKAISNNSNDNLSIVILGE